MTTESTKSAAAILAQRHGAPMSPEERTAFNCTATGQGMTTSQRTDGVYLDGRTERALGLWLMAVEWAIKFYGLGAPTTASQPDEARDALRDVVGLFSLGIDQRLDAALMNARKVLASPVGSTELQKDADRFRWIAACSVGTVKLDRPSIAPRYIHWAEGVVGGRSLRDAIDAAMGLAPTAASPFHPDPELQKLKELAQKATPGPWVHRATVGGWDGVFEAAFADRPGIASICNMGLNHPVNAAYVAAANPEVVLNLIARLEGSAPHPVQQQEQGK